MPPKSEPSHSERGLIIIKMLELLSGALALVAALAWNDAVQSLVVSLFGSVSGVVAKFIYAVLVTVIMVWLGYRLSRFRGVLEKKLDKEV